MWISVFPQKMVYITVDLKRRLLESFSNYHISIYLFVFASFIIPSDSACTALYLFLIHLNSFCTLPFLLLLVILYRSGALLSSAIYFDPSTFRTLTMPCERFCYPFLVLFYFFLILTSQPFALLQCLMNGPLSLHIYAT